MAAPSTPTRPGSPSPSASPTTSGRAPSPRPAGPASGPSRTCGPRGPSRTGRPAAARGAGARSPSSWGGRGRSGRCECQRAAGGLAGPGGPGFSGARPGRRAHGGPCLPGCDAPNTSVTLHELCSMSVGRSGLVRLAAHSTPHRRRPGEPDARPGRQVHGASSWGERGRTGRRECLWEAGGQVHGAPRLCNTPRALWAVWSRPPRHAQHRDRLEPSRSLSRHSGRGAWAPPGPHRRRLWRPANGNGIQR
jgi:hypothetical protein